LLIRTHALLVPEDGAVLLYVALLNGSPGMKSTKQRNYK